jgi:uncharacterized cupredoxin-like copper-binding protein
VFGRAGSHEEGRTTRELACAESAGRFAPGRSATLGVALVVGVVLAACAPSATSGSAGAVVPGTVVVEMGNFFFKPAVITLKAGDRVTLRLINPSAIEHDFFAGRQPDPVAGRYADDFFKDVQVEVSGAGRATRETGAFRVLVEPLGTAQIVFAVPDRKGTYEIGCFLPGHYQAGMMGKLVVQ